MRGVHREDVDHELAANQAHRAEVGRRLADCGPGLLLFPRQPVVNGHRVDLVLDDHALHGREPAGEERLPSPHREQALARRLPRLDAVVADDLHGPDTTELPPRVGAGAARDHDAGIPPRDLCEQPAGRRAHRRGLRVRNDRSERPVVVERKQHAGTGELLQHLPVGASEDVSHRIPATPLIHSPPRRPESLPRRRRRAASTSMRPAHR